MTLAGGLVEEIFTFNAVYPVCGDAPLALQLRQGLGFKIGVRGLGFGV